MADDNGGYGACDDYGDDCEGDGERDDDDDDGDDDDDDDDDANENTELFTL